MKAVWIGCSGWSYGEWRGGLYPENLPSSQWLSRYSETFRTVEVNATFYRLAKRETTAAWAEQTPPGFLFAVKASRYLTHIRRLREIEPGIQRFWEPLEPLREAGKLGPVLWQLPESFKREDELLAAALEIMPPARHCFEFRHPSWFTPAVGALLAEHDVGVVLADDARRPLPEPRSGPAWRYLRFHYGRRGRGGNYSDAELDRWRRRIAGWRARGEVFAYFNNDWMGYAPANARRLLQGLTTVG